MALVLQIHTNESTVFRTRTSYELGRIVEDAACMLETLADQRATQAGQTDSADQSPLLLLKDHFGKIVGSCNTACNTDDNWVDVGDGGEDSALPSGTFYLYLDTSGTSFDHKPYQECARLLREAAFKLYQNQENSIDFVLFNRNISVGKACLATRLNQSLQSH